MSPPLNYGGGGGGDFLVLKKFFHFKGKEVHMGGLTKIGCEGGIQL